MDLSYLKNSKETPNQSKSLSRTKERVRRGYQKYFLYIQERYSDIYCLILKQRVFLEIGENVDNFTNEHLVKVDSKLGVIKNYIDILKKKKNKKITFSKNSLIC